MIKKSEDEEAKRFQELFEKSVDRWLEKKYMQFGRWTLGILGVALFMALIQVIVFFNGREKSSFPIDELKAEINHH